ncbi:Complement component C6 [Thelohanellus kitauei]|uniref:Complement component C6 n=1 Tax=Thelohanellus kitauei TaxID=669202 RepID=A0A0C2M8V7_THEKT|nr:Complement component C6 [Thelohanellus kitauei]
MIQADRNCICQKDDSDCKTPQCAGFLCNNSKCFINNVRCNGVDDCGDNSDEMDCKSGPVEIPVIDPDPKTTRMKRRIYAYLIAVACLTILGYLAYHVSKWIYHIYQARSQDLNFYSYALGTV